VDVFYFYNLKATLINLLDEEIKSIEILEMGSM
jgi:hypothetical protein